MSCVIPYDCRSQWLEIFPEADECLPHGGDGEPLNGLAGIWELLQCLLGSRADAAPPLLRFLLSPTRAWVRDSVRGSTLRQHTALCIVDRYPNRGRTDVDAHNTIRSHSVS